MQPVFEFWSNKGIGSGVWRDEYSGRLLTEEQVFQWAMAESSGEDDAILGMKLD